MQICLIAIYEIVQSKYVKEINERWMLGYIYALLK